LYSTFILTWMTCYLQYNCLCKYFTLFKLIYNTSSFLAHLAFRPCELLPSLFVVRPSTLHILIFSETTGPITTKLWWNGPWMAPFQNCVRWSQLPTKLAAKQKIEKRGDEILKKASPLKLLSQSQPNFAEMILG
jgi:hypothetical protein